MLNLDGEGNDIRTDRRSLSPLVALSITFMFFLFCQGLHTFDDLARLEGYDYTLNGNRTLSTWKFARQCRRFSWNSARIIWWEALQDYPFLHRCPSMISLQKPDACKRNNPCFKDVTMNSPESKMLCGIAEMRLLFSSYKQQYLKQSESPMIHESFICKFCMIGAALHAGKKHPHKPFSAKQGLLFQPYCWCD